jgi:hypothetical protein
VGRQAPLARQGLESVVLGFSACIVLWVAVAFKLIGLGVNY